MEEELRLTSPAFENGGTIPRTYTADGENINPPLNITGVSSEAKSLALIIDDPDAETDPNGPKKVWDHWVLFNISPKTTEIPENSVPSNAVEGRNSADLAKYIGPAPPTGTHRYIFQLYELSGTLPLDGNATKIEVQATLEPMLLRTAKLIGTYKRPAMAM